MTLSLDTDVSRRQGIQFHNNGSTRCVFPPPSCLWPRGRFHATLTPNIMEFPKSQFACGSITYIWIYAISSLACFYSHSSLPMQIAANMVWMVVNMVALDRIHSPNERTKEYSSYYKRKEGEVGFVMIASCESCTCGALRRLLGGRRRRPRPRSEYLVSGPSSALRRPPRGASA